MDSPYDLSIMILWHKTLRQYSLSLLPVNMKPNIQGLLMNPHKSALTVMASLMENKIRNLALNVKDNLICIETKHFSCHFN